MQKWILLALASRWHALGVKCGFPLSRCLYDFFLCGKDCRREGISYCHFYVLSTCQRSIDRTRKQQTSSGLVDYSFVTGAILEIA